MKLQVDIREILGLLNDCARYSDCGHESYDVCCCYCQSKRIIDADDNDELEITDNLNIIK